MNDADLGDNVAHHAEVAESQLPREYRFQNDEAHLQPSRWWFASSAFPMIAGTLGPVASAFSICALVRPWRQHLKSGANVAEAPFLDDPPWLTIINAIQLAVAIVANVFLLLNMARRVRFTIAQPVTMAGWYTSSILLVALTATTSGPLMDDLGFPEEECMWSQAFYYGIWAAVLYFVNASLMAVTFWGAWTRHYDKDFMLTRSQRTLMLQTIMFLVYLLLGALVFSHIEGWNYLDAVYWADVTLFTVGFGDYTAMSTLTRGLLFPYALIGIISLGLVIASIRSMVLERGRRRVDARVEEKKRRRTVRAMASGGQDAILKPIHPQPEASPSDAPVGEAPSSEYERRRAEFELMRKIQDSAQTRRRWMSMGIATGSWFVLWFVGSLIFYKTEKPYQRWTYFDAVYFCFASFTTIGYGDRTPVSPAGKSFFVFWSLLTLPTMTVLISNAGDTVVKFIRDATLQLGNITILPGDLSFMGSLKHIISTITFGHLFPEHRSSAAAKVPREFSAYNSSLSDEEADIGSIAEKNNNAIGAGDRGRSADRDPDGDDGLGLDQGQAAETSHARAPSTFTSKVRRSLSRIRDPLDDDLPTGTDFHFLLVSEIQVVTRHLREKPPRKYSFEEWAWYLKLLGEDERDPDNHRKARPEDHKRQRGDNEVLSETGKAAVAEGELTWSWVGNRSPLAGSEEESAWILERLTTRLKESLSAERRMQMRKKPKGEARLAKRYGYGRT